VEGGNERELNEQMSAEGAGHPRQEASPGT
jgi:hypothetical protein